MLSRKLFAPVALICAGLALAACSVSPQQAQANRDARLAKQFPNPADRQGMFIVFQTSHAKFIAEYLPKVISEATAVERVAYLCRTSGQGQNAKLEERLPKMSRDTILANGASVPVRGIKVACV